VINIKCDICGKETKKGKIFVIPKQEFLCLECAKKRREKGGE